MSEYISNHYISRSVWSGNTCSCTPASAGNPRDRHQIVLQWLMAEGTDKDIMEKVAPKTLHADRDGAH